MKIKTLEAEEVVSIGSQQGLRLQNKLELAWIILLYLDCLFEVDRVSFERTNVEINYTTKFNLIVRDNTLQYFSIIYVKMNF